MRRKRPKRQRKKRYRRYKICGYCAKVVSHTYDYNSPLSMSCPLRVCCPIHFVNLLRYFMPDLPAFMKKQKNPIIEGFEVTNRHRMNDETRHPCWAHIQDFTEMLASNPCLTYGTTAYDLQKLYIHLCYYWEDDEAFGQLFKYDHPGNTFSEKFRFIVDTDLLKDIQTYTIATASF